MAKQKMQKFTLIQFLEMFPSDDTCLEWLYNRNYDEVHTCQNCGREAKFYKISNRKVYSCEFCGHQVSPTAGTIFHKSSTALTHLVLCNLLDGANLWRYFRKANRTRNWRYL